VSAAPSGAAAGGGRRRVRLLVGGRVQGVFYRATTAERARELGVIGEVRNLPDGRVEVLAEGSPSAIEGLIAYCRQGPPSAHVSAVEVVELEPAGGTGRFAIR